MSPSFRPGIRAGLMLLLLSFFPGGMRSFAAVPPPAPRTIRVMIYNTYNFLDPEVTPQYKSAASRREVADMIAYVHPDIAVLTEMGTEPAVHELLSALRGHGLEYPFFTIVHGADPVRHIVFIARIQPIRVDHRTDLAYYLKRHRVLVSRGFGHCVFRWANGYTLHILAAHLKSKRFHPLGQTDMRRYEARQLRYLVTRILRHDRQVNLLVAGDFNDTPNSSPLKTLYDRRAKKTGRLYDLRPADKFGLVWTHLWDIADTYSRIDYALVSYGLLPEIDLDGDFIPFVTDWYTASDHRPLVIVIHPEDRPAPPGLAERFPEGIRRLKRPRSFFHQGRVIGSRRARR